MKLHITIKQKSRVVYTGLFNGYIFNGNKNCLQLVEKALQENEVNSIESFKTFLKLTVVPHWRKTYIERLNEKLIPSVKFHMA